MSAPNTKRSWTDVQLIISSISVALTLGLWGVMASAEKKLADVKGEASFPDDLQSAAPVETLVPGQVLYLNGTASPSTAPPTTKPKRRHRDGDGGGGGGGGAAASTGSS